MAPGDDTVVTAAEVEELLHSLSVADWSRGATFTRTTRGREQTVLSYVRRIVEHEREHLDQIEETLKMV